MKRKKKIVVILPSDVLEGERMMWEENIRKAKEMIKKGYVIKGSKWVKRKQLKKVV